MPGLIFSKIPANISLISPLQRIYPKLVFWLLSACGLDSRDGQRLDMCREAQTDLIGRESANLSK